MGDGWTDNPPEVVKRVVQWDWEFMALIGIGILAVANLAMFYRERKGIGR